MAANGPAETGTREDDAALLERLRTEPASAIAEVVSRFERPLLRHARALVGGDGTAQDVVQEAFIRLLRKVGSVRHLPSWLGRVTHNLAIDHLRREARMRRTHEAAAPELPATTGDPDLPHAVEGALAALTPNERAVIVLKVIEGKSYKEIADATGLSTSNVGYLIHHGLKKLAARLDAAGALGGGVR